MFGRLETEHIWGCEIFDQNLLYLPWKYLPQSHGEVYSGGPGPKGRAVFGI